ncbi:ATP-binding cassette domain-containing protein [Heliobacterium gestii]|uniref:ATP-binding cassette domain-containing protein n=1 Tax=Heliomicrobium gestii TaxID=2699 RepID=A0A845L4D9_HELGE|nr:ABC transporter ATP-binding protein [Heliomicrobium gestii]MBM7865173.1 tungstate transport system ATP-binding protein [Heliomicrobium gestii]MZP41442.1 ATP-binding cassette domain-containing protein [Heliomicrobium gestii]
MPDICAALEMVEVIKNRRSLLQIDDLQFHVGQITAVIGPNGAGKSTLLKVLHGLERPTAGTVRFRGRPLGGSDLLENRRRIAMVFQSPCLFQTTVYENIAAGLRIRGVRRSGIAPVVHRWAARFGVAHLLERQARHLSGGEAQRVALARALACGPELFLLDEPFASLDPPTRDALCRELREVIKEEGITAVIVTHVMEEVFLLADRALMLSSGRVVQDGTPEELLARPVNSEVADFVGKRRILLGRVVARTGETVVVDTPEGSFQLPVAAGGEGTFLLCLREGEETIE